MKTPEELLEIYKEILAANPQAVLSGSLALHIQGYKPSRIPTDIDIVLPYGVGLEKLSGMRFTGIDSDEEYEDEEYERNPVIYKDVKIDVFEPIEKEFEMVRFQDLGNLRMVRGDEILRFKMYHATGESESRHKHKADLLHIINQFE